MTPEECAKLIRDITYKPNWVITEPHRSLYHDALEIRFSSKVPDATGRSGRPIQVMSVLRVDNLEFESTHTMLLRIREAIRTHEEHEMDEWLKYKDKCVTDPHPEKFT
jgi:hypothetical protein